MGMDNQFWLGLLEIIGVNIVLSGDNAVVIAMAARSLAPHQQRSAIILGSGAAIILRVILTTVAASVLALPYLKMTGSLLLLWIGIQLLVPERPKEGSAEKSSGHLMVAVRIIIVADFIMSLDNVIAVAGAAHGNLVLLILGLAISIPLIIFGSTAILKLIDHFPGIIKLGAGLLGYVAGEMFLGEPVLQAYMQSPIANAAIPWIGAALVLGFGAWISKKSDARKFG
jgi:YjbE family integral membrane protein